MKRRIIIALFFAFVCGVFLWKADEASAETIVRRDSFRAPTTNIFQCTLTDTGVLTISGKGECQETEGSYYPWREYRDEVKQIVVEEGVTGIGAGAFYNHRNLTRVVLPESVTSIASDAFNGCVNLTDFVFPDSIEYVGGYAFSNCVKLADANGMIILNHMLVGYVGEDSHVVIPNDVHVIAAPFYCNDDVISITIPDSVTRIGEYAFAWCNNLEQVSIPEGLTDIGKGAFYDCDQLAVDGWGIINGILFTYCGNDEDVIIPDGVKRIDNGAFRSDYGIENVVIPRGVVSIGKSAFEFCSYLKTVSLPDTLTTIEEEAFEFCNSMESIVLPDSLISIGSSAFSPCESLKSITIPQNVQTVGSFAFSGCENLESVNVLNPNTYFDSGAFARCNKLADAQQMVIVNGVLFDYFGNDTTIVVPENVTRIEGLWRDNNIRSIVIPNGVNEIGTQCFYGCTNMTSISLPDSIEIIDGNAFRGCTGLTQIRIPDHVKQIDVYAFEGCTSLTSVTLPAGLKSVGMFAFYNCSKLKDVYYKGNSSQWSALSIGWQNDPLINAVIHYNASGPEDIRSINDAVVSGVVAKTYTGKKLQQYPVVSCDGVVLQEGRDYTLSYKSNTNAGTASLIITGSGNFIGTITKSFRIKKAVNPLSVKARTASVKYSKLKKSNQTLTVDKILAIRGSKGALTFKKALGSKKININTKTGKAVIKKGLTKGTYKVKIKVKAAGNANYKASTVKTVTVKVKVK